MTTEPGASVTATLGGATIGPVVAGEDGGATLRVDAFGTWTLTAEKDGESVSDTVEVTEVRQYAVALAFFAATINVTAPEGSAVTVSLDGTTVNTHTGTGEAVDVTVHAAGAYDVTATDGEQTASGSATIEADGDSVSVEIAFLLPVGYTELEYIESGGTQYLNTNVIMSNATEVNVTFKHLGDGGNLFGIDAEGDASQGAGAWLANGYIQAFMSGGRITESIDQSKHNMQYNTANNHHVILDGTDLGLLTEYATFTNLRNLTMFLMARHNSVSSEYYNPVKCDIYHCTITVGSTVTRDYYPARRNSDNAIGMYDLITDTFFTNAGTGTFIAGPEV